MRQFLEHESPRLRLVAWRDRHIAPFVAMNSDPEVMRYFPSLIGEEQSRASVEFWMKQFEQQGWSNWAVELKDTDEFIGFVGLWVPKLTMPFSPCVEIGWRLARRFWGQGYATEGAQASLRVGFEQLGLAEVVSYTALPNAPSRAVMERIGMHNTGADFDHPAVPIGSALRRHCLYKITRDAWVRIPSQAHTIRIRPSRPGDLPRLFEIWRAAVDATHGFVSTRDLANIATQVREQYLPNAVLHAAVNANDHPLAFMGMSGDMIDSLFVDPACHGRGIGRYLVEHGRKPGRSLAVDVNEQNVGARQFYERLGFVVVGRSELDSSGLPYPLLHLRKQ